MTEVKLAGSIGIATIAFLTNLLFEAVPSKAQNCTVMISGRCVDGPTKQRLSESQLKPIFQSSRMGYISSAYLNNISKIDACKVKYNLRVVEKLVVETATPEMLRSMPRQTTSLTNYEIINCCDRTRSGTAIPNKATHTYEVGQAEVAEAVCRAAGLKLATNPISSQPSSPPDLRTNNVSTPTPSANSEQPASQRIVNGSYVPALTRTGVVPSQHCKLDVTQDRSVAEKALCNVSIDGKPFIGGTCDFSGFADGQRTELTDGNRKILILRDSTRDVIKLIAYQISGSESISLGYVDPVLQQGDNTRYQNSNVSINIGEMYKCSNVSEQRPTSIPKSKLESDFLEKIELNKIFEVSGSHVSKNLCQGSWSNLHDLIEHVGGMKATFRPDGQAVLTRAMEGPLSEMHGNVEYRGIDLATATFTYEKTNLTVNCSCDRSLATCRMRDSWNTDWIYIDTLLPDTDGKSKPRQRTQFYINSFLQNEEAANLQINALQSRFGVPATGLSASISKQENGSTWKLELGPYERRRAIEICTFIRKSGRKCLVQNDNV